MSPITAQAFIDKWGPGGPAFDLNERQGAQAHFIDLCELLDVPKPGTRAGYLFEEKGQVVGARTGFADVFMRDVFVWENKTPGSNLDQALRQLLAYSFAMSSPPILVVSDRLTIRIHTQFTGHPSQTHVVLLEELNQPETLALLRRIWNEPESFKPRETNRDITESAARNFADLAESLRLRGQSGTDPGLLAKQVAHFLTQCLFCFFAEDVGLLPGRMFEKLVGNKHIAPERLTQGLAELFTTMGDGGLYGADDIPRFNGNLFKIVEVPPLNANDVSELRKAANLNWSAIDVSIIGTLFERGLDPDKRSQFGAHYTDTATIDRLIDPVLRRPLLKRWDEITQAMRALMAKSKSKRSAAYSAGRRHFRATAGDAAFQKAEKLFFQWLESLRDYRVLDPACGSGNFLYLGLKCLKDIELKSHLEAATLGLDRPNDLVTGPHNVLGIELNEYAAELARVTVWIGELQWRTAHGFEFKINPVLEALDHIECRDALLSFARGSDPEARAVQMPGAHTLRFLKSPPTSAPPTPLRNSAVEAAWPQANVVIGNPPFLGDRKMIRELGEDYTSTLRHVYDGRVPGGADLVCYWFEKARTAIEVNGLGAAGLVATNSIRGGANRKVLDAICQSYRIFEAWSDEGWVNEGAAVRVSLIAFGHAMQAAKLDGVDVAVIAADLSAQDSTGFGDLTNASKLAENTNASFIGTQKNGPFDIPREVAVQWLGLPNPHGKSNALVVRPWANGLDVTRRPQDRWVVDFGCDMPLNEAVLFEAPFGYVDQSVRPTRISVRRDWHRTHWWLYGDARPGLRERLSKLQRFVVTAMVAKHRLFAWMPAIQIPENLCVAIARADDTTFGILHSRFHELWSLRMGTALEDRPRYTPTTCFETFPFPTGLTPADTAHQQTEQVEGGALIPAQLANSYIEARVGRMLGAILKSEAHEPPASAAPVPSVRQQAIQIALAAKRLSELREAWLNPNEWTHKVPEVIPLGMSQSPYPDRIEPRPGLSEVDLKALKNRTLTKLYNLRPQWLVMAHQQLDNAVANAYGWSDYRFDMPDEEILKGLLALNLERSRR